ncbi:hypothetical protein THAOC_30289, partial [Thalassiosira oceanica]
MTDEVKPPANRALREGQRELSHTITKLIKEKLVTIEDDEEALTKLEEQIEAVELWVDWDGKKDMKEDLRAYNYRILQRYKINRAEYHGGDLTGVDIKKLMHDAANIMKEIREYLINSLHDDSNE